MPGITELVPAAKRELLEEMLAALRLSLDGLEVELLGAARPALRPL